VSPGQQLLLTALQRRVTYAGRDRPFRKVLRSLSECGGVPITLDAAAIEDDGIRDLERTPVSLDAKDQALADVLTRLLEPHGLQWIMGREQILVTFGGEDRISGFYHVPGDLLVAVKSAIVPLPGDPPGLAEECLSGLMMRVCEPVDSWGSGALTVFATGEKSLVVAVSNTLAAHRGARRFLDRWRSNPHLLDDERQMLKEIQGPIRDQAKLRAIMRSPHRRHSGSPGPCISIIPVVG
jgi:hypothetical protein